MKNASVQHLNALVHNREYASSYHLDFSKLNHIGTAIMNKLTNVSPFLLFLVPVFIMMVFTLSTNMVKTDQNEVMSKQVTVQQIASTPVQYNK
jgi:hypothetical protein